MDDTESLFRKVPRSRWRRGAGLVLVATESELRQMQVLGFIGGGLSGAILGVLMGTSLLGGSTPVLLSALFFAAIGAAAGALVAGLYSLGIHR